jgi:hypothetical protein
MGEIPTNLSSAESLAGAASIGAIPVEDASVSVPLIPEDQELEQVSAALIQCIAFWTVRSGSYGRAFSRYSKGRIRLPRVGTYNGFSKKFSLC